MSDPSQAEADAFVHEGVFVRLTADLTAVLVETSLTVAKDADLVLNGVSAGTWCLRRVRGGNSEGAADGTVILLRTGSAPPLQDEGELTVTGVGSVQGPALADLDTFRAEANPEWARALAAVLLSDAPWHGLYPGDPDFGTSLARLCAGVAEARHNVAACRLGPAVLQEADESVLPAGVALGHVTADRLVPLTSATARLTQGRRCAAVVDAEQALGPGAVMYGAFAAAGRLTELRVQASLPQGAAAVTRMLGRHGVGSQLRGREAIGALLQVVTGDGRRALARSLVALQRQQGVLKRSLDDPDTGVSLELRTAVPIGDEGLFLAGTIRDPDGLVEDWRLRTPLGERMDIGGRIARFSRAASETDPRTGPVDGFAAYVPLDRGAEAIRQVRLTLTDVAGGRHAVVSETWRGDDRTARRAVLDSIPAEAITNRLLETTLYPALLRLQRGLSARKGIAEQVRLSNIDGKPAASVVVPLYGEYGFIRHQMQAFAVDPDFADVEVLYVLDAPWDRDRIEPLIRDLHRVYGVNVRLVVLTDNYGYAAATNLGAFVAKGRKLLLLNSDVVPAAPGWLKSWIAAHDAADDVGISGARLLFADGSLQHAGLYFDGSLMPWWVNRHYAKGLPADWPAATTSREVPGVTGAAALIDKRLYRKNGGLSEDYVIGDFEDSDLCLRLRTAGYRAYYFAEPVLYHMERMSVRRNADYHETTANRYNGWLHTFRHGEQLAALAAEQRAGSFDPSSPRDTTAEPAQTKTKRTRPAKSRAKRDGSNAAAARTQRASGKETT